MNRKIKNCLAFTAHFLVFKEHAAIQRVTTFTCKTNFIIFIKTIDIRVFKQAYGLSPLQFKKSVIRHIQHDTVNTKTAIAK